jgi:copper transport protein
MNMIRSWLGASARYLVLALILALSLPSAALAHATLVGASPEDGAVLQDPIDHVELTFNEPVDVLGLTLIDADGRDRSPASKPQAENGRIIWTFPAPLPDGRYLLSWRVASLDGHVIGGTFQFGIGHSAAASKAIEAAGDPVTGRPWLLIALHATARVLLLLAVGTALFQLLNPFADTPLALERTNRRLAIAGLGAFALFLLAEGAARAGLPLERAFSGTAFAAVLQSSSIAIRAAGMVGLALMALARRSLARGIGAILAVTAMADTGHVLAALPAGFGQSLMIAHGLAAAIWMGAIEPLRRSLKGDTGLAVRLFRRFQIFGAIAMGATLASGVALSCILLPRLSDLWQSDYGLRLLLKIGAVSLMVGIAIVNRLWLSERALAAIGRANTALRIILGIDLGIAMIVTALAVGLSLGSPPAKSLDLPIIGTHQAGFISLVPGRVGDNDLTITLGPKAGLPAELKEVEVRLTAPGLQPIVKQADRLSSGSYEVRNLPLWIAGHWHVDIYVLIDDFTQRRLAAHAMLSR